MFVKIGRLTNLYFIIIIVIHKNEKKTLYKHCISYNFKIKCARN